MKYVLVDPAGDHKLAGFDDSGMTAPALTTGTGGSAVWTGLIVNQVMRGGTTANVAVYSDIMATNVGDIHGSVWRT